jgi:two-component system nitrogen regulation sensor histidine kinase NtrY
MFSRALFICLFVSVCVQVLCYSFATPAVKEFKTLSIIADYIPLLSKQGKGRGRLPVFTSTRYLAGFLIAAAIVSGMATYAALNEMPPLGNDPATVIWLLNIDLIILLLLVGVIARRIAALWSGRKRGLAGSHLHVRLVYTFSILAAAPAIIMTVFAAFFFHFGVQTWFSERVETAINESQAVAEAYLEEHKQVIRADTLAMANDLDRAAPYLIANEEGFGKLIQTQSLLRNLSEAVVFDTSGRVLARSGLTFMLEFEEVPQQALKQASEGEVVIMTGGNDDRVRALVKLGNLVDTYLYVGRMVDSKVLSHVDATRRASKDYADLENRYSDLQVSVTLIFVVVGLLLMLVAIWFGLILARQLVSPISILIRTADRVRAGDLAARVPEEKTLQEFDYLAKSFNRMTKQIQEQQNELIEANRQLDRRRRFTEAVLEGVSSGVIGLDNKGGVTVTNNSAVHLLGLKEKDIVGTRIEQIMPEVSSLLKQAHARPKKITQGEIPVFLPEGGRRALLVRIAIELIGDEDIGAILTFDDITELQSAQRKAAWADVARRIAHEIKNPLTPIQLSAERLRRKYLSQIKEDPETFSQCTDTIIKHVADIGHMVNEFSSFARMPEPVLKWASLPTHVEEALFLHIQAHPEISFTFRNKQEAGTQAHFDPQQVRQALNNLLQNAIDSIESRENKEEAGQVNILLTSHDQDEIAVVITDNGIGLPKNETPERLTEPYVTHKHKGTGLGLAIVKKIMEDHGGKLVLGVPAWLKKAEDWQDLGGATVALVFRIDEAAENEQVIEKAAG